MALRRGLVVDGGNIRTVSSFKLAFRGLVAVLESPLCFLRACCSSNATMEAADVDACQSRNKRRAGIAYALSRKFLLSVRAPRQERRKLCHAIGFQ